jgi:hypothetical protein
MVVMFQDSINKKNGSSYPKYGDYIPIDKQQGKAVAQHTYG